MIIERFSQSVIGSGILRLYVAVGFFASLIFFVLNADHYSPMEMLVWMIVITIALKGIAYLMLSMIILLFSLENKKAEMEYYSKASEIEQMLADLVMKEAESDSQKQTKGAKR
ncbi:MAG: hypothetical protein GX118_00675 [Arcobacter butzleri]|jgi:phosphotransferase system  glucose/maltose/N-acetylglucosamine-specific IIC component|nr:hypothetical protein [Arcobacteraceae bacterium]MDY0365558.1 hypothetical protein [Arcobacteraceae bacterium]NLO16698.1 hypothetical protein [Aliarcobacter butzleri]